MIMYYMYGTLCGCAVYVKVIRMKVLASMTITLVLDYGVEMVDGVLTMTLLHCYYYFTLNK